MIAISATNLDAPLKVLSGNSYGILVFEPTFGSAVALRTVSGTLNWHRAVVIRTRLSRSLVQAENPSNPPVAMAQADSDISQEQRPKRRPTS